MQFLALAANGCSDFLSRDANNDDSNTYIVTSIGDPNCNPPVIGSLEDVVANRDHA